MFINFRDLPGNHNLFLDYLYEFEKVKSFYGLNFRNKEEFPSKFKSISESSLTVRNELSEIVKSQYELFNPSQRTQKNISLLKDKKTLAVTTGQQLGIMCGPLYTFYKIVTAIKLSNYMSERYDEFQFVPIFWLEGDDHDFEEVRSINLIAENNEISKIIYSDGLPDEENRGSIGSIKLTNSITNFLDEINKVLRTTEFKQPLMDNLKNFYSEGKSFKQAFKELLFWIFDQYGLIIFDPQDLKVKNLLKPVFKKEILDFRQHTEKLVNISATLEELYHAQVKVRPVNLFYSYNEGRFLIEPVENEFRLRGKRKKFSLDELLDTIEKTPEAISPNVLLRPICQDYLLPTAFYVAGPSEISYFAQVAPLYKFYQLHIPIVYPRSSATIIEKNINSIMEKFELDILEVFADSESLKNKIMDSISDSTINEAFTDTANQIEISFDRLKEKLFEIDKTISDSSTKYKQKILHQIDELKMKSLDAQKKKHEITLRQIDKVSNILYPNSNLQERELNFIYFYNKYGMDFIKQLFDELTINKFEHQIIRI